jgi:hypothetical protein
LNYRRASRTRSLVAGHSFSPHNLAVERTRYARRSPRRWALKDAYHGDQIKEAQK